MGMQVRFQSDEQKADEYARSNGKSRMLPNELAKPIGVVNGTNPRASHHDAWRNKATFSECISYKLDADGNKVDAKVFAPATSTRTSTTKRTKRTHATTSESKQLRRFLELEAAQNARNLALIRPQVDRPERY